MAHAAGYARSRGRQQAGVGTAGNASSMATATTKDEAARLIFAPNVLHNNVLTTVKFLSSFFAGAVSGVLGLENWAGFGLFVAATLFTAACIYAVNCKGRPKKYIAGGAWELVNPGQDNVFSFVLAWTLFFGACTAPAAPSSLTEPAQASCTVRIPPPSKHHFSSAIHSVRLTRAPQTQDPRCRIVPYFVACLLLYIRIYSIAV